MSDEKYILSLDIGTTGLRAIVFDKTLKVCSSTYVKTQMIYPKPGWVEMDPIILWEQVLHVIKTSLDDAKINASQIISMGIATQRNTFTTWHKETGQPLHNFITWQDVRTAKDCRDWNSSLTMKGISGAAKVAHVFSRASRMKAAGSFHFTTVQASIRLAWVLKNMPDVAQLVQENKVLFGGVETWILYKLTNGAVHATDFSNISATGLFDPFIFGWNDFVFNMLNLPRSIMPKLMDTSGFFGNVASAHFGSEIPIHCIVADQQSALFGECCFNKGDAKCTMGTGMMIDLNTGNRPHASDKSIYPLVGWKIGNEIAFIAEGVATSTGSMVEWGRQFGFYSEVSETSAIAESVSDSNGVYLIPAFNGLQVPYNDPTARAAFMGMTFGTRREHCVRALLEAIGFQFKQLYEVLKSDTNSSFAVLKCDGGVCNNSFLMQLCSTLVQTNMDCPEQLDMTAVGAAYFAGLATGYWGSKQELISLRKSKKVYQPEPLPSVLANTFRMWERSVQRCLNFADTKLLASENASALASSPSSYSSSSSSSAIVGRGSVGADTSVAVTRVKLHVKARCETYPSGPSRFAVPDNLVSWTKEFKEYAPVDYTAAVVLSQPPWADVEIRVVKSNLKFNSVDGNVDRTSFEGVYELVNGLPRNPKGRTGITGRGLLGRWGPNHAADPIVSRWKKDPKTLAPLEIDGKRVLEFVGIRRKDNNQWAIPGGMVEPGDTVSATLKKEFGEESLNSYEASEEEKLAIEAQIDELFKHGQTVFKGYVDDPRNTDNAWMETVAVNFHDEGTAFDAFKLQAGDDAGDVTWVTISKDLELYASHSDFVLAVAKLHNAHL